ncbi:MAG: hypothetical protein AAF752_07970, partial [Bacteroidota bacterium]
MQRVFSICLLLCISIMHAAAQDVPLEDDCNRAGDRKRVTKDPGCEVTSPDQIVIDVPLLFAAAYVGNIPDRPTKLVAPNAHVVVAAARDFVITGPEPFVVEAGAKLEAYIGPVRLEHRD